MNRRLASIYAEGHSNNSLFAKADPTHTYAPTHTSRLLKKTFLECNIEINTADLNLDKTVDFELYVEGQEITKSKVPKYLIATENPHINVLNCDAQYCIQFKKVFSFNNNSFFSHPKKQLSKKYGKAEETRSLVHKSLAVVRCSVFLRLNGCRFVRRLQPRASILKKDLTSNVVIFPTLFFFSPIHSSPSIPSARIVMREAIQVSLCVCL